MLLRSLVVVGLVGLASMAVNRALAEDTASRSMEAVDGVSFADPAGGVGSAQWRLSFADAPGARFSRGDTSPSRDNRFRDTRSYELAVGRRDVGGLPVDVEFAGRAAVAVDADGEIARHSRGSELRLGRGLGDLRRRRASLWSDPTWYIFAASDDEALTWRPGRTNSFGGASSGVAVEDRVEIGDLQAGITYERGPLQASLAYVEREVSTHVGGRSLSQDENFTGLTVTLRH
jgi:hypothetical protein